MLNIFSNFNNRFLFQLCTYRSVRTLKNNKNCLIDFNSFEMDNKKINYEQWHAARSKKQQQQQQQHQQQRQQEQEEIDRKSVV